MTLPPELTDWSLVFQSLFSKRVWPAVQVLLQGAILAVGPRTIAAILRVMGRSEERQFERFHRVLNRVKWSPLMASRRLLMALIAAFAPSGPLVMALDDTIERRRGARIAARGIYRDPVQSSHSNFVKTSGLRWLCLMLVVPIPWARRHWALPFCSVLAPSQRYYLNRGRAPCRLADRARQMLLMLKRWLPERSIVVVADSSFAVLDLLGAVCAKVSVVTRLRLDAALYDPAPPRLPGIRGRPPLKGPRRPRLRDVLHAPATRWQPITLAYWYGRLHKQVEVATGTALWYHGGAPAVPLRWVLVRDPKGTLKTQAFLCTDQNAAPAQILEWFVTRWQIEVTFEETRAHLGMQTQRQWSTPAIARTTPAILALYSLVTLLARDLLAHQSILVRQAAWYRKDCATFSDTIALVRRWLWHTDNLSVSKKSPGIMEIPTPLFERLTDTLSYAC
jgi:DDE superfamily endonuclease